MSAARFVPDDFDPPRELAHPAFRLVPLGTEHNESDHAAWSSSIAHVRATPGTEEVIGCVYIYPAKDVGHDARVRSWVRADVADLDGPLHAAVARWLDERWPFERVIYAERLSCVGGASGQRRE